MAQWFRLYETLVDDPKVQRLKPELFKAWVNMLALACRHDGVLPSIPDLAFALREGELKVGQWLHALIEAGLLDVTERGHEPHNWASRQFKGDTSAERMRRHRERHRNVSRDRCDVTGDVTVTASESESDTDTDSEPIGGDSPSPIAATPQPPTKIPVEFKQRVFAERGTSLPKDWTPSDETAAQVAKLRPDLTEPELARQLVRFRANALEKAKISRDWGQAWIAWAMNARSTFDAGPAGETFEQRRIRLCMEAIK